MDNQDFLMEDALEKVGAFFTDMWYNKRVSSLVSQEMYIGSLNEQECTLENNVFRLAFAQYCLSSSLAYNVAKSNSQH